MLSHAQARRIASEWHGGSHSPLYAFVSTGRITDNTLDEAAGLLEDGHSRQDHIDLRALQHYLDAHRTGDAAIRSAWADLWSETPATMRDV
jgi:hypothetical protein